MRNLAWRATGVLAGSMLLFSMAMFVAGNRVAILLYGPKYEGNGLIIFLITLSYAIGAAGFALSCGFFAAGRGNLDVRISWVFPLPYASAAFRWLDYMAHWEAQSACSSATRLRAPCVLSNSWQLSEKTKLINTTFPFD